jgi:hypothetical protein
MKKSAFASARYGLVSVAIGVVALPTFFLAPYSVRFFGSLALGVLGFVFGIMSVKTKIGATGILLSLLTVTLDLYIVLVWIAYGHR